MDRLELLKRAGFAGLALALPAPAVRYLEELAAELPDSAFGPELGYLGYLVQVLVLRGHGYGKMATATRINPYLLDDVPFGVNFVKAATVEQMLVLQEREPGRASEPVSRDGSYLLVDSATSRPIGAAAVDWRELAVPDPTSSAGALRLVLIDA